MAETFPYCFGVDFFSLSYKYNTIYHNFGIFYVNFLKNLYFK